MLAIGDSFLASFSLSDLFVSNSHYNGQVIVVSILATTIHLVLQLTTRIFRQICNYLYYTTLSSCERYDSCSQRDISPPGAFMTYSFIGVTSKFTLCDLSLE